LTTTFDTVPATWNRASAAVTGETVPVAAMVCVTDPVAATAVR
jgi:hypothetical protein